MQSSYPSLTASSACIPSRSIRSAHQTARYVGTMQICVARMLQESGMFFAVRFTKISEPHRSHWRRDAISSLRYLESVSCRACTLSTPRMAKPMPHMRSSTCWSKRCCSTYLLHATMTPAFTCCLSRSPDYSRWEGYESPSFLSSLLSNKPSGTDGPRDYCCTTCESYTQVATVD